MSSHDHDRVAGLLEADQVTADPHHEHGWPVCVRCEDRVWSIDTGRLCAACWHETRYGRYREPWWLRALRWLAR